MRFLQWDVRKSYRRPFQTGFSTSLKIYGDRKGLRGSQGRGEKERELWRQGTACEPGLHFRTFLCNIRNAACNTQDASMRVVKRRCTKRGCMANLNQKARRKSRKRRHSFSPLFTACRQKQLSALLLTHRRVVNTWLEGFCHSPGRHVGALYDITKG